MIHILLLLCFISPIFAMNISKNEPMDLFKQKNWDNRFTQLTTDRKEQLGLYLIAYKNSPLAKESLHQFLLNGLGEVEREKDTINAQKILFDGINTDNSTMVKYAFSRGANSNSELDNRSPLAQALLVSSDEVCELLLEHKAEASKPIIESTIQLKKFDLVWKFLKKSLINNEVKYSILVENSKQLLKVDMHGLNLETQYDYTNDITIVSNVVSKIESFANKQDAKKIIIYAIKLLLPSDQKYKGNASQIIEKIAEKNYPINDIWPTDPFDFDDQSDEYYYYQKPALEVLIKCKASVNHIIEEKVRGLKTIYNTPLSKCIHLNFKESIEYLLDNGADINQKTYSTHIYGKPLSPLELSIQLGRSEIVKLLTLKGAK